MRRFLKHQFSFQFGGAMIASHDDLRIDEDEDAINFDGCGPEWYKRHRELVSRSIVGKPLNKHMREIDKEILGIYSEVIPGSEKYGKGGIISTEHNHINTGTHSRIMAELKLWGAPIARKISSEYKGGSRLTIAGRKLFIVKEEPRRLWPDIRDYPRDTSELCIKIRHCDVETVLLVLEAHFVRKCARVPKKELDELVEITEGFIPFCKGGYSSRSPFCSGTKYGSYSASMAPDGCVMFGGNTVFPDMPFFQGRAYLNIRLKEIRAAHYAEQYKPYEYGTIRIAIRELDHGNRVSAVSYSDYDDNEQINGNKCLIFRCEMFEELTWKCAYCGDFTRAVCSCNRCLVRVCRSHHPHMVKCLHSKYCWNAHPELQKSFIDRLKNTLCDAVYLHIASWVTDEICLCCGRFYVEGGCRCAIIEHQLCITQSDPWSGQGFGACFIGTDVINKFLNSKQREALERICFFKLSWM